MLHILLLPLLCFRSGAADECSICLNDMENPVITLCGHIYCRECIERVISSTNPATCPLCRENIKKSELLDARDAPAVEGAEASSAKDPAKIDSQGADTFTGSCSSKVNAMLQELNRIRKEHPDDKIIVVSQFTSFLTMIAPLVSEQGFSYVRFDGTLNQTAR